jgi:hypothetical protein
MSKFNANGIFKNSNNSFLFYLGAPLWVGLSVPAFFVPKKNRNKKELHFNPSRKNLQLQRLSCQEISKISKISPICVQKQKNFQLPTSNFQLLIIFVK